MFDIKENDIKRYYVISTLYYMIFMNFKIHYKNINLDPSITRISHKVISHMNHFFMKWSSENKVYIRPWHVRYIVLMNICVI